MKKEESKNEFLKLTKIEGNIPDSNLVLCLEFPDTVLKPKRENKNVSIRNSINKEKIFYQIKEDDESFVKLIKNEINDSKISLQDLYNSKLFKNNSEAYNLYYSLTKHRNITEERLKKWLSVLNKKIFIYITK